MLSIPCGTLLLSTTPAAVLTVGAWRASGCVALVTMFFHFVPAMMVICSCSHDVMSAEYCAGGVPATHVSGLSTFSTMLAPAPAHCGTFEPSALKLYVDDPQSAGLANSVQKAGAVALVLFMHGASCCNVSCVAMKSAAPAVSNQTFGDTRTGTAR